MTYNYWKNELKDENGNLIDFFTLYEGEYLGGWRGFIAYKGDLYEYDTEDVNEDRPVQLVNFTTEEKMKVKDLRVYDEGYSQDRPEGNSICVLYTPDGYEESRTWDEEEARDWGTYLKEERDSENDRYWEYEYVGLEI